MSWTAGADVSTGDLITAATWNNYLGATGSIEWLQDNNPIWAEAENGNAIRGYYGQYPVIRLTVTEFAVMSFPVPAGYSSIDEASIWVIPRATQAAANWDLASDYGAVGEDFENHQEADAASTYNVTDEQLFKVDVSGVLTGIAAGDLVGMYIYVGTAGHNVDVVGLYFRYS